MDNEIGNKSSPTISMHEFLDFLKISCQLQESIDQRDNDRSNEHRIDYNNLAKNSLVNTLVNAKSTLSPRTESGETNGVNNHTANGNSVNTSKLFWAHFHFLYVKQINQSAVIIHIVMASRVITKKTTTQPTVV